MGLTHLGIGVQTEIASVEHMWMRMINRAFTGRPFNYNYSKTYVKRPLSKRQKICFQDQLSLNAGQKYHRMLQGKHSVILSTFIKLPYIIKIFVLSIFEWPCYTGFTVQYKTMVHSMS